MITEDDFKMFSAFSYEEFKEYQLKKLVPFVKKLRKHSKYYKKTLSPFKEITSYDHFSQLPFLSQDQLREIDIEDLRGIRWNDIRTVIRSSGSTGKSKVVLWSKQALLDETKWGSFGYLMQKVTPISRLAIIMPFDMTRIPGVLSVCNEIGAFVIPIGRIRTDIDLDNAISFIKQLRATHLLASPSRLASIAQRIDDSKQKISDFEVKYLICGGTTLTPQMRTLLEQKWNAELFEEAGANELSFIAFECSAHDGLHLTPGLHYIEVINEQSQKPITKENEIGEIVVTNFNNLGTPLLRYKLGDIGYIKTSACSCGLRFPRLFILGRVGGQISFGGTKLYAYQIESILSQYASITMNYQVKINKKGKSDIVHLIVETHLNDISSQKLKDEILKNLTTDPTIVFEIFDKIENREIQFLIQFVPINSLERSSADKIKNQYLDMRRN